MIRLARALVGQAQHTGDVTVRATLAGQFDALLSQIDQLAGETGAKGISLLGGDDLPVVSFNDAAAGDLTINYSQNNWATDAYIDVASAELKLALVVLRSRAQALRSSFSTPTDPSRFHQGNCRRIADS